MNELLASIANWPFLEIIAVFTAIVYLVFATKGNRWCFLFGGISSLIYVYITFSVQLYFDLFINVYYVVISIVGWMKWSKQQPTEVPSKKIPRYRFLLLISTGLIATATLGFFAANNTDASLPYLDAFTTTFSVIATWMIVQQYIENWWFWIVVDAVAAGMYWHKDLQLTSLLFLLYTLLAVYGYVQWKKRLHA